MCSSDSRGTLEGRIYQVMWHDGSVDLMVGLGLILVGVAWLFDQVALSAVVPALMIPLWMALRKGVVEPRLGLVQFSAGRESRTRCSLVTLVGIGIGLCLGAVWWMLRASDPTHLIEWSAGIPSGLVALGLVLAGLLLQLGRLVWYGAAATLITVGGALMALEPWAMLATCGAVPLLTGAVLFLRFLNEYPVPTTGEPEA